MGGEDSWSLSNSDSAYIAVGRDVEKPVSSG